MWTSEGMDRSRSAFPRLLHITRTIPQAEHCPRLPLPMSLRPTDSYSHHGLPDICVPPDRAIGKLRGLSVTPLIEHADFLEALEDYDILLTTPAA